METKLPRAVEKLAEELAELPSIGPRQALRLAFYLVSRGPNYLKNLSEDLDELRQIKTCERCFFVHQNKDSLCDLCKNPARKQTQIMLVEKETDLISVENTGKFHGRYFILGAMPKTGLLEDWQKLRLKSLEDSITKNPPAGGLGGKADEIILALNPTGIGDFHASLITKELQPFTKKISRLGRGLPTGGEIEFADDETLGGALENRS
jgi:recombination protein RecR